MTSSEFASELTKLRVYGFNVRQNDLENLERLRLVVPQYRIYYPDTVARRFYRESRIEQFATDQMTGDLETDGERWTAAVGLEDALHQSNKFHVYGRVDHPLLNPSADFAEFVQIPAALPFTAWEEFRVDVSTETKSAMWDNSHVRTYYSSWQLLLAAEVADVGIHIRCSLTDVELGLRTENYLLKEWLPNAPRSTSTTEAASTLFDFRSNEAILNAVDYFSDQANLALFEVTKNESSGRFILQGQQLQNLRELEAAAAHSVMSDCSIDLDRAIALIKFLAERWAEWEGRDRPSVAGAYKQYLARTVQFIRLSTGVEFDILNQKVGQVRGYHQPILDVIWPDWEEEEKQRLIKTLKTAVSKPGQPAVTDNAVSSFADYVLIENLQTYFWVLKSFEEHAFGGSAHRIKAMQKDVQSLALAVEHLAMSLGANDSQLHLMFQQLWSGDPAITALIKGTVELQLARDGLKNGTNHTDRVALWNAFKSKVAALQLKGRDGYIAADLLTARFIRGAVHYQFPVADHFELEGIFVGLLRASLYTFCQAKGAW
jgi:hypothetical protein